MKAKSVITILFSIIILSSCKKNDITAPSNPQKGKVTEKGTSVADAVSKSIGSEGGSITSADGIITVTIPGNAVSSTTTFSIQPIINKTPNGIGLAYRLLPEGTHFDKPVTITFHYSNGLINGSLPQFLHIAYQDTSGIWLAQKNAVLDKVQKTISVTSFHFSDWSVFEEYELEVDENYLTPNESTNMRVKMVSLLADLDGNEFQVGDTTILREQVTNWNISPNKGTLISIEEIANYTAPQNITASDSVTVSADVNNIVTSDGTHGKEILLATIHLVTNFMEVNFRGKIYQFPTAWVSCSPLGHNTAIFGGGGGAVQGGITFGFNGVAGGTFHFGDPNKGEVEVAAQFDNDPANYVVRYTTCNPEAIKYTDGTLTVSKIGGVGEYVEGTFSGNVVSEAEPCNPKIEKISGRFRVMRIY